MTLESFLTRAARVLARRTRVAIEAGLLNPWFERRAAGTFAGDVARSISQLAKTLNKEIAVDTLRFPDGKMPVFDRYSALEVKRFIRRRCDQLNAAATLLADRPSRSLLARILAFRALGPAHVALPITGATIRRRIQEAQLLATGHTGVIVPPLETPLEFFEVAFAGERITVECWGLNILQTFIERQYYFARDNLSIAPTAGDVVLDLGACFGDTALAFAATVGPMGGIHTFECLPRQLAILEANLMRNPSLAQRVWVCRFAVSDESGAVVRFIDAGAGGRISDEGVVPVTTISIDDYVEHEKLRRVDFIKMDIEGGEMLALRGAAKTIRRFYPKLAISLYHSLNDMVDIPALIADLGPEYRLYINHHTTHADETVLYAAHAAQMGLEQSSSLKVTVGA
jgi:FkbM family methyltransferase